MVTALRMNGKILNRFYSLTSLIEAAKKLKLEGETGIDLHGELPRNNPDGTLEWFFFSGEWSCDDVVNLQMDPSTPISKRN